MHTSADDTEGTDAAYTINGSETLTGEHYLVVPTSEIETFTCGGSTNESATYKLNDTEYTTFADLLAALKTATATDITVHVIANLTEEEQTTIAQAETILSFNDGLPANCVGSYRLTETNTEALRSAIRSLDADAASTIIEAVEKITFSPDKEYEIRNYTASNGYLYFKDTDNCAWTTGKSGSHNAEYKVEHWRVQKDGDNYILYNVKGGILYNTVNGNGHNSHWKCGLAMTPTNGMTVTLTEGEAAYPATWGIRSTVYTGDKSYLHCNTEYTTGVTGWLFTGSPGSHWYFIECADDYVYGSADVTADHIAAAKKRITNQETATSLSSLTTNGLFGDGYGKYSYSGTLESDETATSKLSALVTKVGTAYTNGPTLETETNQTICEVSGALALATEDETALQAFADATSLNLPKAGTFLTLYHTKSDDAKCYLTSDITTESSENRLTMNSDEGVNALEKAIFYYDGETLTSLAVGKSVGVRVFDAAGTKHQIVIADHSLAPYQGLYELRLPKAGSNNQDCLLYGEKAAVDKGDNPTEATGYTWSLEDVTTLPVATVDADWATFYTPVALNVDAEAEIYTGAAEKTGVLTLTKLTDVIPAETAVVMRGKTAYSFAINTTDGAGSGISKGALEGTYVATTHNASAKDILTLQMVDSELGFFTFTGTELRGFRAWLPTTALPAGSEGVRALVFEISDEVTQIVLPETQESVRHDVYDLSGRRVTEPTRGLYIIGGKKVYIK